jgi:hypothetical protein
LGSTPRRDYSKDWRPTEWGSVINHLAWPQFWAAHVRFGSKADIGFLIALTVFQQVAQQLQQLDDIRRDPPRLIAPEQLNVSLG